MDRTFADLALYPLHPLCLISAVWFQDFYAKKPGDAATCAFEVDLLAYLGALGLPRECGGFLGEVGKVDFSKARALGLVASVPGYHRGGQRDRYGHMRLRGILSRQRWPTEFEESDLVCQFSSLGSIDEKWLKSEFTQSMASQMGARSWEMGSRSISCGFRKRGRQVGAKLPLFPWAAAPGLADGGGGDGQLGGRRSGAKHPRLREERQQGFPAASVPQVGSLPRGAAHEVLREVFFGLPRFCPSFAVLLGRGREP